MLTKRLAGDAVWVLLARLIIGGSSMIIIVMLSRLISSEDLGHYMLLLSLVLGMSIFAMFGMDQLSVRELAKSKAKNGRIFSAKTVKSFFLVACVALFFSCFILFLGKSLLDEYFFKSPMLSSLFVPICLWISFFVFAKLSAECFRGMHKVLVASFVGETLAVIILILLITLALAFDVFLELSVLVWLMVVVYGVSAFVGGALLTRYCSHQQDKQDDFSLSDAFSVGRPLTVIAVISFFISQADLWVLALFFEAKEVAIYGVVLRVIALVSIPLMIVNLVIKPYIPSLYAQGEKKKLEKMLRTVCTLVLIPSTMALFGLLVYSEELLGWLFGESYVAGAAALSILVLAKFIQTGVGSCGTLLIMTGHQKDLLYISFVNGLVLIILLVLLVEPFGIVGCASVSTFSVICQNLAMLLVAKYRTGIWTHVSFKINIGSTSII